MVWSDEISGVVIDAAFWWIGLEDAGTPVQKVGDLSLEVSYKLRTLAILALLGKASTDGFVHGCTRAARARRIYLRRLADAGVVRAHHLVSGCYEPLLDAIAAGDIRLVREIAELSPADFRPPDEYEDDYCYAQLLQRLCSDPVPEAELQPLLDRFAAYLDGADNPRLQVCGALAERNTGAFAEAFENFLAEFEARLQKNIARGQLEDVHVLAQRSVSVEGLAILRLADLRGITTDQEYQFCPSLARRPASFPCPDP